MSCQYSFDDTTVGDWRWRRKDYDLIHRALRELANRVHAWNDTAIRHGALRTPYEQEETDIVGMVAWGDDQLREGSPSAVEVKGISVGSLRYIKAALLLAIRAGEQDVQSSRSQGWPSGALQTVDEVRQELETIADRILQDPADILWELVPRVAATADSVSVEWDIFISHASEDKDTFVRLLAAALQKKALRAWFDEFSLTIGDSLRRSIDRGLAQSRYGVVVISPAFLTKEWPQKELDGLIAREVDGHKVVLPVWHHVDARQVRQDSPLLADRLATSSIKGVDVVVSDLLGAMI